MRGEMIGAEESWLRDLLTDATENFHLITDKSQSFVISMRGRLDRFGSHTVVSPAQQKWLRDIEERLADGLAEAELYRDDLHDDYEEYEHGVPVDEFMRGRR